MPLSESPQSRETASEKNAEKKLRSLKLADFKKPPMIASLLFSTTLQTYINNGVINFYFNPQYALSHNDFTDILFPSVFAFGTYLNYKTFPMVYHISNAIRNYKSPSPFWAGVSTLHGIGVGTASIALTFYSDFTKHFVSKERYIKNLDMARKVLLQASADRANQYLNDDSPRKDIELSALHFIHGDLETALKHLQSWVDKYRHNLEFQKLLDENRLSQAWRKRKKPKNVLSRTVEKLWNRIASDSLDDNHTDGRADSSKEKRYTVFFHRGMESLGYGKIDEALDYFEKALKLDFDEKEPNLGLGLLLMNLDKKEKGANIILEAIKADPTIITDSELYPGSTVARKSRKTFYGNAIVVLEGKREKFADRIVGNDTLEKRTRQMGVWDEVGGVMDIGFLEIDSKPYYIIVQQDGELQKSLYMRDIKAQVAGIRAHALIQAAMTQNIIKDERGLEPHRNHVLKALENDRVFSQAAKRRISDNFDVGYMFYSSDDNLVYDTDANPYQAVMKPHPNVGYRTSRFDLDKKGLQEYGGYNRHESDDAKQLFFGNHIYLASNPEKFVIEQIERKLAVFNDYCIDGAEITNKKFIQSLLATVPIKALSYAFYSANQSNSRGDAGEFLHMGELSIVLLLGRYFMEDMNLYDGKRFEQLKIALRSIKAEYQSHMEKLAEKPAV